MKYNSQGQVEEIREGQIFDDEGNVAEEGASLYLDPETDTRPATRFAYDRYNRLKERKEADGTVHRYKYDCRGNLLRLTYPDGGLSVFDYDEAGRMVKATLCDGRTMRWAYDARGNVVEQTDGRGAKTSYQYDAYDLLKSVTNPKGDAVELSYDGALRLKEVKNALGETYSFERDDAGRVVEEHDFSGRTLKYRLDKAGQVTERLGADNLVTALSYDKLGQLTEVAVFDGELDEKTGKREPRKTAYAYDILGRVTEAVNPSAEVKLEYDPLGRVLSETINGQEIRSAYSLKGRTERSIIGLDAPHVANASYDIMGRMRSYQIGNHDPLLFGYNERGFETSRGVQDGFYQTQRYSAVGELAEQRVFAGPGARESARALLRGEQGQQSLLNAQGLKPDQPIAALVAGRDYEYDATGAPRVIADLLHGRTTYQTDANGQVKQAKHQQANQTITENFQYHPTLDVKGSSVSTATPVGKVLDQSQETWGRRKGGAINKRDGLDWTYDQAGRVVEKVITRNGFRPETHKFEWNGQDQFIGFKKVVNHEVIEAWEYSYDAFSRRVVKTCTHRKTTHEANDNQHNDNAPNGYRRPTGKSRPPIKEVKFLWDRHSLVAEQKVYADGTTAHVVWHYDPGQPFTPSAREETGQVSYAVKDHLGTPRELIAENGKVQWTRAHLLWGQDAPRFRKESAAENDNHLMPFRFQGQQFDEETGLSYNRFRYYDQRLAGYSSSDPLRLRGGLNAAGFSFNASIASDPLGLCTIVLGETMTRVQDFADSRGFSTIADDWDDAALRAIAGQTGRDFFDVGLEYNRDWLRQKMANGCEIMDIGIDPDRADRSIAYAMEQEEIKNYDKVKKIRPCA